MKVKIRLINDKWFRLSLTTKKSTTNIIYWGGFKLTSNKIYANK